MKNSLSVIFLLGTMLIPGFNHLVYGQSINIEFRAYSPGLPDDSTIYITGSLPQLGNWDPSRVPMKNTGNHVWSLMLEVKNPISFEYKYTLGDWSKEGADALGNPLSNFVYQSTPDNMVNDTIPYWTKPGTRKITGQITGKVTYHRQVTGFGLEPRDLIVWLPPTYNESSLQRFPVLYMHDGQNIFDPSTSSFGPDWQIDETCDSMIRNKLMEPIIVVGIYNTGERMHEYTPNDTSARYMQLVTETIKPLIDKEYRTLSDREHTFVGGSSAGGIISFVLCWEYPQVFSKAICMSPAFKIGNIDYVKTVDAFTGAKKPLFFYIDNGGIDLEAALQPGIDNMLHALNLKGYQKDIDYYWQAFPEASHNEAAWAKRFPAAIQWIVNGKN